MDILISAIVSGLLGVIVTITYYKRAELRRNKINILNQLIGNRNDLKGQPFTEALNQVFVGFHDSKEVLARLKDFHDIIVSKPLNNDIPNQKLTELFKAMCKDLKININPLTDDFFLKPFNVRS